MADRQRAAQLETDMKKAKTVHDKALKETLADHEQTLEQTLADNQKALREARVSHEQAVQVNLPTLAKSALPISTVSRVNLQSVPPWSVQTGLPTCI